MPRVVGHFSEISTVTLLQPQCKVAGVYAAASGCVLSLGYLPSD